jgi:hypothetical protein
MKIGSTGLIALMLAFIALGSVNAAGYTYTTLDYPGAIGTGALGEDGGTVVGAFFPSNAASLPCDPDVGLAFKYDGVTWTPLLYPGSVRSAAQGISGGTIVGGYVDAACADHGFLLNGSTWTSLEYPGAEGTFACAIDGGIIVGMFERVMPYSEHGFLYTGGSWKTIDYPGARNTRARGIAGNNIVGEYTDNGGLHHGFLYNGSSWLTLDYPGAKETWVEGITGDMIAGYYRDNTTWNLHGLTYNNGVWTTFDFPGATNTYGSRIDTTGRLVGYYEDTNGPHGFLAAPTSTPVLTLTKSGTGTGTITSSPSGINCGGTCSASYDSGTMITLTATPDAGSSFTGWSAPCSGTGTCTVTLNTSTQVTATFVSSLYFDTVQKFYLGYYQRPADPAGLLFWANALSQIDASRTGILSRESILPILHDFAYSDEARSLYGGDINPTNIATVVNSIYKGLFNRDADPGGLAFYVTGFNTGGETPATILWSIMGGAQGTDALSVQNKVTAAMIFTRAIDPDLDGSGFQYNYSGNIVAQRARDFLSAVTWDSETLPTPDEIGEFFTRAIQLPRTGQVKCYDSVGTEIVCTGTGQDGDHRTGVPWPVPRFTAGTADEADCITDTLTGLMWTKNANLPGGERTWNQAIDDANERVLCGHGDWRLPDINELESLVHTGEMSPPAWLLTQGFTNVQTGGCYWSSTTAARTAGNAWLIGTDMGDVDYTNKSTNACYVWPARGDSTSPAQLARTGQTATFRTGDDGTSQKGAALPDPRFTLQGECVIDTLTGLMWPLNANPSTVGTNWAASLDFANSFTLCGQTDWRLPNRKELMSLLDRSQHTPPLPSDHPFTNVQLHGYWSSTTAAGSADGGVPNSNAWVVVMGDGHVDYVEKNGADGYYAIWPVRGGVLVTDQ